MRSVAEFVVWPAVMLGWRVRAVADVIVSDADRVRSLSDGGWTAETCQLLRLPQAACWIRVRASASGTTQITSVLAALEWAERLKQVQQARMILLLRNDVHFKHALPLTPPAHMADDSTIFASFAEWRLKETQRNSAVLRLADALFIIPTAQLELFKLATRMHHTSCCMHELAHWLHQLQGGVVRISTLFFAYHDADAAKDWNPLYTMTGRVAQRYAATIDRVRFSQAAETAYRRLAPSGNHARLRDVREIRVGNVSDAPGNDARLLRVDHQRTLEMVLTFADVPRPLTPWDTPAEVSVDARRVKFVHEAKGYAFAVPWPASVDDSRVAITWWALASDGSTLSLLTPWGPTLASGASRLVVRAPLTQGGTDWHPVAERLGSQFTCHQRLNYVGACLPSACPLKRVASVEACQALCSARVECAALVHNELGECYLKSDASARKFDVSRVAESTIGCRKG